MMRSLWSGVSGLTTHLTEMDVIGNNISNVNTTAYKSQSTGFQDVLYQTLKSGGVGGTNTASTNYSQVGVGAKVGSINTNITLQGSAITTNNAMDLMITGDSFFCVTKDVRGQTMSYTRDGSFTVDASGDLVTQNNGFYVMGVMGDGGITDNVNLTNLKVIDRSTRKVDGYDEAGNEIFRMVDAVPGTATTYGYMAGNIDRDDPNLENEVITELEIYGQDGKKYTLKFKLTDNADTDDSTYMMKIDKILDEDGQTVENTYDETLIFYYDKHNGRLTGIAPSSNYTISEVESQTDTDGNVTESFFSIGGTLRDFDVIKTVTGHDGKEYDLYFSMRDVSYSSKDEYHFNLDKAVDKESGETIYFNRKEAHLGYDEETGSQTMVDFEPGSSHTFTFEDAVRDDDGDGVNDVVFDIGSVTVDFSETAIPIIGDVSYNFRFGGDASKIGTNINIDFSNTTNYASMVGNHRVSLNAYKGDLEGQNKGYQEGELTGISFTNDGSIYGTYSNGQTIKKAQIVVAEFSNANGLEKIGDNLYAETLNSGTRITMDVTSDGGYISSGVLEGSNINLAKEFTDMITTQRGFQANSKVITTSDEILQLLHGLKR